MRNWPPFEATETNTKLRGHFLQQLYPNLVLPTAETLVVVEAAEKTGPVLESPLCSQLKR